MSLRAKMDYNNDYNKRNYKSYTLRFNRQTESEIIEYLAEKDTTPYIRSLIRADMIRSEEVPVLVEALTPPHLVDDLIQKHGDIAKYPYEILEKMPFYDRYVVAYCADLEECKAVITDYCLKHTQVGELSICKRFKDSQGNIYSRRIRREFIYNEAERDHKYSVL